MVLLHLKKIFNPYSTYSSKAFMLTLPLLLICLADLLNRVIITGLIAKTSFENVAIIGISSEIFRLSLEMILSWNIAFQIVAGAKVKSKYKFDSYLLIASILIFSFAIIICILISLFNETLLGIFKQSQEVNHKAAHYISWRLWTMPFFLTSRVFLSVFLVNKEKRLFTIFCILEAFLSFISLYFQFLFGWIEDPLSGTAIAYSLRDIIFFLFLLFFVLFSRKINFSLADLSISKMIFIIKDLNKIAFPELFNSILLFSSSFIFFTISSWIGITSLSIFKIIIELTSFLWMFLAQFGTSIQIITSNHREIDSHIDLIKNQQIFIIIIIIITYVVFAPVIFFPDIFVKFYTEDISLSHELKNCIKKIVIILPLMVIINANNGLLRGLQKNTSLILTNVISFYFFLIPLAFLCWYLNYGGVDKIILLFFLNYLIRGILSEILVISYLRSKILAYRDVPIST